MQICHVNAFCCKDQISLWFCHVSWGETAQFHWLVLPAGSASLSGALGNVYISHFGTTQLILLLYWWSVFLRGSNHIDKYTLGCSRPSNSHHQDHYSRRLGDLLLERGACQDTEWNSEFRFWCFHRPKSATLLGYPASPLQQSKGWQGGVKAPWPVN